MALLNLKKNTAAKSEAPKKAKKLAVVSAVKTAAVTGDISNLIMRARVTEKTTLLSQQGRSVHVFERLPPCTKLPPRKWPF